MFLYVMLLFAALAGIDFLGFLALNKRIFRKNLTVIIELMVVVFSVWVYLDFFDIGLDNDCCSDSAVFSPEHRLTAYFWILICTIAFIYTIFRQNIAPPLIELVLNSLLVGGIIFNCFLGVHIEEFLFCVGNLPIILVFTVRLIENQQKITAQILKDDYQANGAVNQWAAKLLQSSPLVKYPILILLCLPLILVGTAILMLFGQQPDALIRAFTDTYKHGFSQLDFECDNVICGGHYLCSVAANGHVNTVKPVRLGVRNGGKIICNRQLLISNAFEELMETKAPKIHRFVRNRYNRVGNFVHRYYGVFENKFFADFIYYAMKPLEFVFWIVLYSTERNPENRIAQQYLSAQDRNLMSVQLNS